MQDIDSQLFAESVMEELLIGYSEQSLSGGQKQRLALGTALMNDAQIIILDEPTSGLDGKNMMSVAKLMRELASEQRLVIIITHDYELAINACDRVIRMDKGEIILDGQIKCNKNLLNEMITIEK